MDCGFVVLTCVLLIQMVIILVMLNPVYDVCKLSDGINHIMKYYKGLLFTSAASYFAAVLYLGMYIPMQNIHRLIITPSIAEVEKVTLLHKVEMNYIIAGFSLFLVVVIYGIRALLSYTASVTELAERHSGTMNLISESKEKTYASQMNNMPNLLRVKRSISYETILFTRELQERLKVIIKKLPNEIGTLSNLLDTTTA